MNPVLEEMQDVIMHYGVGHLQGGRSGRYPWGSGDQPYQTSGDFLSRIEELRKNGWVENAQNIQDQFGLSMNEYRAFKSIAGEQRKNAMRMKVQQLYSEGKNRSEVAKILGVSESTIRGWEKTGSEEASKKALSNTVDVLKKVVDEKGIVDVGEGVEREIGISKDRMVKALEVMRAEGYEVAEIHVPQVTQIGQRTDHLVLMPEGYKTKKEIYDNLEMIQPFADYYSPDEGLSFNKIEYPSSIDSSRVMIRYGDQGGLSKDGTMEIRQGVKDLDLGDSHYAQVRILVDGTHYLKGMALYSDNMPDGYDIVFNTNKMSDVPKMDVLKKISKDDPENPFGAAIKPNGQYWYEDSDGTKKLGAINKLKEETDWNKESLNLSQQFLSKQSQKLIESQLNLTYADYQAQYDEIKSLNNPTLKRKMLKDFAETCDTAAVELKAAALPRMSAKVILPIDSLKDNEVYAPTYNNGERVVLVRYPHAGPFEIPELVVNNNNKSAKNILGNVQDAIGINSKVAEKLSGADFDGDSVRVIPVNNRVKILTKDSLKGLEGFEPKIAYATDKDFKGRLMKKSEKGREMGIISNLITDMSLQDAPEEDIVKAVRHSMVVIDAEKHKLDYKRSEIENDIPALKKKYQARYDEETGKWHYGGASSLLSRRKQEVEVPERRGSAIIDPETGKVSYKESGRTYYDKKTGTIKEAKTKIPLMKYVDDAEAISLGTAQEKAYAKFANDMKAMANDARKTYMATERSKKSPEAAKKYAKEVQELEYAMDVKGKNAPKERRAQVIANSRLKALYDDNPQWSKKEKTKAAQRIINNARVEVGASGKATKIHITPKQWEAIQAGAISDTFMEKVLRYGDQDEIYQYAMPKTTTQLSDAKINKAKAMKASGHYTYAEIAEAIGCSASTVSKYL